MLAYAKKACLVLCLAVLFHVGGAALAVADAKQALRIPPDALDGLSKEQLNALGTALLTEIYATHTLIGSPKGEAVPKPEQVDKAALARILDLYDEDVLIQRSRLNHGLTKATFFPHSFTEFKLSDVAATRSGSTTLILSYNVIMPDRTTLRAGMVMSGESKPRITVLRWRQAAGMWKIFSYADFDTPQAVLCDADTNYVSQKSSFKAEDVALAEELLEKMQTASLTGTEKSVQAEGFQYVFASGERKTETGKVRARLKKHDVAKNFEAIRSGDLFVMRFDSESSLTLDGGAVESELKPGIMTFRQGDDGQWRMVAIGIFAMTAKVAKGTPCVE